jgi:hypothetical protein
MYRKIAISIVVVLSISTYALTQVDRSNQKTGATGMVPVLWREPADIATRNLYLGPGGEEMKPDIGRITLVEEPEPNSSKYRVRDASGREWVAKASKDTQAEVAAGRLAWAVGYYTDISYLVPLLEIEGKGTLRNARLEARPKGVKRLDEWRWDDNPFIGTNELQGLKVLLTLLDNWNLKNENNKIVLVRADKKGTSELHYLVSDFDFGAGRAAGSAALWEQTAPQKGSKFISAIKGDTLQFDYAGPHKERLGDITVDQARWIGGLLSRLSERQIQDAFRAANYSEEQVRFFTQVVRMRIGELVSLGS